MKNENAKSRNRRIAVIICACILFTLSASGLLTAALDLTNTAEQDRIFVNMEILYDESQLVYIPELPYVEYDAGVHINFSDTSYISPDPAEVQWSSDNHEIFWVNTNGGIHPTGVGTAHITAEYLGYQITQVVTIHPGSILSIETAVKTIIAPPSENVYPVSLVSAYASNGVQFEVSSLPSFQWISENPEIAEYTDNGVLLSNIGNTTLTASIFGKSAQVDVIVVDTKDVVLTGSVDSFKLFPNLACDLIVTATYGEYTADVTRIAEWSVSNENVVQAIDGYVSAYELGEATITVTFGEQKLVVPVEVAPPPTSYPPPAIG
jgi:hypothetical protein